MGPSITAAASGAALADNSVHAAGGHVADLRRGAGIRALRGVWHRGLPAAAGRGLVFGAATGFTFVLVVGSPWAARCSAAVLSLARRRGRPALRGAFVPCGWSGMALHLPAVAIVSLLHYLLTVVGKPFLNAFVANCVS